MRIQVDTGDRLDQSGNTTFAFCNGIEKVYRLRQRDRDIIMDTLKGRKLSKEMRVLTACIYLLIEEHLEDLERITIDNEYDGHQGDIKRYLLNLIQTHRNPKFKASKIRIEPLGKKVRVHKIAWKTYRSDRQPDKTIQAQEVLDLLTPK